MNIPHAVQSLIGSLALVLKELIITYEHNSSMCIYMYVRQVGGSQVSNKNGYFKTNMTHLIKAH